MYLNISSVLKEIWSFFTSLFANAAVRDGVGILHLLKSHKGQVLFGFGLNRWVIIKLRFVSFCPFLWLFCPSFTCVNKIKDDVRKAWEIVKSLEGDKLFVFEMQNIWAFNGLYFFFASKAQKLRNMQWKFTSTLNGRVWLMFTYLTFVTLLFIKIVF